MKKVLIVFGTRPEVIKMAPLVKAFSESKKLRAVTCASAQHRDLLDQVLSFFKIAPDYDLDLMKPNQDLYDITSECLKRMKEVLRKEKPDCVLVQGDTTTTFASALAAFYEKIPVGHVEAGLRTHERYSPFPEEMNRKITTPLSDFHFAPTQKAFQELIQEKIDPKKVFLTGNTSIDALLWALEQTAEVAHLKSLYEGRKLILMTAHRRENFGEPLKKIFLAVREFATQKPNFHIIYPVHPNPNVKDLAHDLLYGLDNVSLISPLNYPELIFLMKECEFVLTDSGGLQEESPALGKPVLVLRASTERPEAVDAGCAKLVGHDAAMILEKMAILSDRSSSLYQSMSQAKNPFGNGTASLQIRELLENQL